MACRRNDRYRLVHVQRPRLTRHCAGLAERSMTASQKAVSLNITKPCPICDHHMELGKIETVTWGPNACAERLVFRCEKCGVAQTQWNATPTAPGINT